MKSKDPDDLTEFYISYRECVRLVWNSFCKDLVDAEGLFKDVENELFLGMLYTITDEYVREKVIGDKVYYPAIRVIQTQEGSLAELFCCQEDSDNKEIFWKPHVWQGVSVDFRWKRLFDWQTRSGEHREFEYVEAIVVRSDEPIFAIGQRVLIPASKVQIVDVSKSHIDQ